jgi:acyl-CoA synthetase (AMP-forming)/AMP-acid ligase II
VSWLPFFHDMGLVGVLLCSLLGRFAVHVLRPAEVLLHPRRWLEVLSGARATVTVAPNFGFELLIRRGGGPSGLALGALRAALSGSEPVLRSTIDAFEQNYRPAGLRSGVVLPVYGLAENTLGVTFGRPGVTAPDLALDGRFIPSVGTPLGGVDVAIRRANGSVAAEGEEGEISLRGPSVMEGYVGEPEATRRVLMDGWLYTGDRGVVRAGQLYVTGRDKDLVIKAGRKFHPADIEREVAQVVDTPPNGVAAFSVLREQLHGEELVVVVEARRSTDEDVERKVRGRLASTLGVTADRVVVVKAGALPRTTSGKLRRAECAARFGAQP